MVYIERLEGEIYTKRQIYYLLYNTDTEITISCDSVSVFSEFEIKRFQFMGKYKIFVHKSENHSIDFKTHSQKAYCRFGVWSFVLRNLT